MSTTTSRPTDTRYHVSTGIASTDLDEGAVADGAGVSVRATGTGVVDYVDRRDDGRPTEHYGQSCTIYLTRRAIERLYEMTRNE